MDINDKFFEILLIKKKKTRQNTKFDDYNIVKPEAENCLASLRIHNISQEIND